MGDGVLHQLRLCCGEGWCPAPQSTMLTLTCGAVEGLPEALAVVFSSEDIVAFIPQARHAPRLCSLGGAAETHEP